MTDTMLVMLHGWGTPPAVWREVIARLPLGVSLWAPDWYAPDFDGADTVDALADRLAALAPAQCAVAGWSLGGQIALAWAERYPAQVSRVAVLNTTAKFVRDDKWVHGLLPADVATFEAALRADTEGLLRRFALLQSQNDAVARKVVRDLRDLWREQSKPAAASLRRSLCWLLQGDLRDRLPAIRQPALVIHGLRDTLVPAAAGRHLVDTLPRAEWQPLAQTAHVPLLGCPDAVADLLTGFFGAQR